MKDARVVYHTKFNFMGYEAVLVGVGSIIWNGPRNGNTWVQINKVAREINRVVL